MNVLRTPDTRFVDLPDYPFTPHYLHLPNDGEPLRLHYLDEGEGPTIVLLHGEPTWSYLYRHMLPPLVEAGFRVVAPDLIGFGKSDKPADVGDYTYRRHLEWLNTALFEVLALRGVTLFCQDWGGLLGLRLVAATPERFDRVVVANTGLPTGEGEMPEAYLDWLHFSQSVPQLPIGDLVQAGSVRQLSDAEVAAYDAPFPDETFKAGARAFPALVPTTLDAPGAADNRTAWAALVQFSKPFLTAFSDGDPITAGGERAFQSVVPGADGQPHVTVTGGGHFLQEDRPEQLAALLSEFMHTR